MENISDTVTALKVSVPVAPEDHKILVERLEEGHWHLTRGNGKAICCGAAGRTMKLVVKTMMQIDPSLVPPEMVEKANALGEGDSAEKETRPTEASTTDEDSDAACERIKKTISDNEMYFDHFLELESVKYGLVPALRKSRSEQENRTLDIVRTSFRFDKTTSFYMGALAMLSSQLMGLQPKVVTESARRSLAKLQGQPDPGTPIEDHVSVLMAQATVIEEYLLKKGIDVTA